MVHVEIGEKTGVLCKIQKLLKKKGILYASWKYGTGERIDNQKYYADYDEKGINELFSATSIKLIRKWVSEDSLIRSSKWLNVIGEKE